MATTTLCRPTKKFSDIDFDQPEDAKTDQPSNKPEGIKFDQGKPLADTLHDFAYALLAVTEVATKGAKKYARGNWQKVQDGEIRYRDAKMRHYLASRHEEYDPDFGLLHEVHEAWCTLAALELKLRRIGLSNMYKPANNPECAKGSCKYWSSKRVNNCTRGLGDCSYEK